MTDLPNDLISPLFEATIEATEEAILNSLVTAQSTSGFNAATGKVSSVEAISLVRLAALKA